MTNETMKEVEVIQADIARAADYWAAEYGTVTSGYAGLSHGEVDDETRPVVEMLARHRLASSNPPPVRADVLEEALRWYGEQARLARLIHSEGDAGRHALAADGGKRALAALSTSPDVSSDGREDAALAELDRPHLAALHRLQHEREPLAKPKLGGSITGWAAEEIAALRAAHSASADYVAGQRDMRNRIVRLLGELFNECTHSDTEAFAYQRAEKEVRALPIDSASAGVPEGYALIRDERAVATRVDDEITCGFIDGWNARLDHDDFDMALHFWMREQCGIPAERSASPIPPSTVEHEGGSHVPSR